MHVEHSAPAELGPTQTRCGLHVNLCRRGPRQTQQTVVNEKHKVMKYDSICVSEKKSYPDIVITYMFT